MGGKVLVLELERLIRRGERDVADATITPQQGAKNLGITIAELKRKNQPVC